MVNPFAVTDCALVVIATGEKAQNLRELYDRLNRMKDPGLMYFHFWDGLLRPDFVDPEYQNDFAAWAFRHLHDQHLAEKLSILNPGNFKTMDDLRHAMIRIIEDRMDEIDFDPRIDADQAFYFMRSQIVIFDTRTRIQRPEELGRLMPDLALGSIFYHFVDARRRTKSGRNDFTEWLRAWGDAYAELAQEFAQIDPYFKTLLEMREQLSTLCNRYLKVPVHDPNA